MLCLGVPRAPGAPPGHPSRPGGAAGPKTGGTSLTLVTGWGFLFIHKNLLEENIENTDLISETP